MVKILPTVENINRPIKNLIPFSLHKRNLNYQKLPNQLLKLSVVKLDGSSFSFQAPKDATMAKIKIAIEEEFNHSHEDKGKMLWPTVWSHFCLCYGSQKLIYEKAIIESYGIKDGDQLHFVQHMRTDHTASTESPQKDHAKSMKRLTNTSSDYLASPVRKSAHSLTHSLTELLSRSKFISLKRLSFNLVKTDRR